MTQTRTGPRFHTLTGTHQQVAAQVARLRQEAAVHGEPIRLTLEEDRAAGTVLGRVTIGTVEPQRAPARRPTPTGIAPRTRNALVVGGVAGATTVLGAAAWLTIVAVSWVAEHLAVVIGAGAVVLVLYGLAVRATGCPGLHCLGCSGH
jgi:hypothetical protein